MEVLLLIVFLIATLTIIAKTVFFFLIARKKNKHRGRIVQVRKDLREDGIRYICYISIGSGKIVEKVMKFPIKYETGDLVTFFLKSGTSDNYIIRDFDNYWSIILKYFLSIIFLLFGCFEIYKILVLPEEHFVSGTALKVSFFALFVIFSFFSVRLLYRAIVFRKNSIKAFGTITGFEKEKDVDNIQRYRPIVSYKNLKGETHFFCSSKMLDTRPVIGDKVKLVYDINMSENAELDSFFVLWGIPIFCTIFSIISFIISVIII